MAISFAWCNAVYQNDAGLVVVPHVAGRILKYQFILPLSGSHEIRLLV
jgi:hypothetical protein